MTRVSVVIPAYNVELYLERALESVLAQTMPDLEVLVVDDGSTDGTLAVAEALAAWDSRVQVLHIPVNQGVAEARNRALAKARGEWVALLDGDDTWLPERLAKLLDAAEAAGADIVSDDVLRVDWEGQFAWSCLRERWYPPMVLDRPTWLRAQDLVEHHLGVLQPLVRRSFLEQHHLRYNTTLPVFEDFVLCLQLLLRGARWLQLPEGYYLYFQRPGSATLSTALAIQAPPVVAAFEALLDDPAVDANPALRSSLNSFLKQEALSRLLETVRANVCQGNIGAAVRLLLRQPTMLPPILRQAGRRWAVYARRRWRRMRGASAHTGPSGPVLVGKPAIKTPMITAGGAHKPPSIPETRV